MDKKQNMGNCVHFPELVLVGGIRSSAESDAPVTSASWSMGRNCGKSVSLDSSSRYIYNNYPSRIKSSYE